MSPCLERLGALAREAARQHDYLASREEWIDVLARVLDRADEDRVPLSWLASVEVYLNGLSREQLGPAGREVKRIVKERYGERRKGMP